MYFQTYLVITIILTIKFVNCEQSSSQCTHQKTNREGVCITIQNCQEAREEFERNILPQSCGFDNGIPKVCCQKKFDQVITFLAEEKCKEYSQIYEKIPEKIELFVDGNFSGSDAKFGEYPHMAILGYGHYPDISWDCGGTLISEKFVLTTAYCISRRNVTLVQLGDVKVNSDLSKTYEVRRVHKYPDYIGVTQYHDVGLVELSKAVDFSVNIMPACLPKTSSNIFPILIATGFAQMNRFGNIRKTLQWTNLQYFQNSECVIKFKNESLIPNGVLDQIQICYGSRNSIRDTCQSVSGDPLQYADYETSLHRIVGVTSFGKSCGSPGTPGIYTKVQFYIPWIESVVWRTKFPKQEVVFQKRSAQEKCEVYSKQIIITENTIGLKFPHIADIGNGDDRNPNWYCDGTLISEKFVLTSGWCAHSHPKFVQLGKNSHYNSSTIIKIAKIYTHPNFKYPALYNDIALLQLQLSVKFSSFIKPACLYTNTDDISFLKFKTTITKWDEKEVEYKYFNCRSDLLYVDHLLNGLDSTTQFCFINKYVDNEACRRFGGASLQFFDLTTNLHRVIGVLTPLNLCEIGKPRYFTKVAAYIDWIEDIVWN